MNLNKLKNENNFINLCHSIPVGSFITRTPIEIVTQSSTINLFPLSSL